MIYLLTGNKKERKEYIQKICSEREIETPSIQNLYNDDFRERDFHSLVPLMTGLFGEKECFVVHGLVRDVDIKKILQDYSETEHSIIFSEDTVLKKDLTLFEKAEVTIQQFEKEQKTETQKYNTFALADLLGARDKKNLWLGFREAIKNVSAEEIHGILFWQVKNLALVKTSASNPGLNSFVYSKNKGFAENYSKMEILKLSSKLVKMFHERDAYSTLEIDLEKMILNL